MPAGSVLPIAIVAVDDDFDMQAVVDQEHGVRRFRLAAIADELAVVPGQARRRLRPRRLAVLRRKAGHIAPMIRSPAAPTWSRKPRAQAITFAPRTGL